MRYRTPAVFLSLLVFGFFLGVRNVPVIAAPTAQLKVNPATGTYTFGAEFNVNFQLTTGGQAVGGVQVDVIYSPHLEFVSFDATGSVFNQEVIAPAPSNGAFQFARIRFDTGYDGSDGQLLRMRFRAASAGSATITISQGSEVIAYSDSSNILQSVTNGSYTVNTDPGAQCGDNVCNLGENCGTCPGDCPCAQGQVCIQNACSVPIVCGDGACSVGQENCATCLADCPCEPGRICNQTISACEASEGPIGGGGGGGGGAAGGGGGGGGIYRDIPFDPSLYTPVHTPDPTPAMRCSLVTIPEGQPLPNAGGKLHLAVSGKEVTFTDVRTNEWFARFVASLIQSGIASGYKDAAGNYTGLFGPGNHVLIGEITKMSLNLASIPTLMTPAQNPSARGQWSEPYIAAAESKGISVYRILPNVTQPASRGMVLQILLEALDIPIQTGIMNPYTDLPSSDRSLNAILTATQMGVVQGDTTADGSLRHTFRPGDPVNRAETAKMLVKLAERGCQ